MQEEPCSPSGLKTMPSLRWGAHLAHFFEKGEELRDVLVPYFKAGLENNERCLWVTGAAFTAEEARSALRAALPDLDRRERGKQIEITNAQEWYAAGQKLAPQELVNGLVQREQEALGSGYAGLRTNGNCAWVSPEQWADFIAYETLVQKASAGRRMISMCSYCIQQLQMARSGNFWPATISRCPAETMLMGRTDMRISRQSPTPLL
jgi:DcmR-like sensory protein